MKRVAGAEDNPIVKVPLIVRVCPVVVELERAVVVAFNVEHVRVAAPVGNVRHAICITVLRILSELYLMWHHNALA